MTETSGSPADDVQQPSPAGKCTTCKGLLYFSHVLNDAERPPTCVGVKSRRLIDCPGIAPGQVPGTDFRYICVGYSVYDEEQLKINHRRRSSAEDMVDLPLCEGLEIVSAKQFQQAPVLNTVSGPTTSASEPEPEPRGPGRPLARGRTYGGIPQTPQRDQLDLSDFPDKFRKSSQKLVEKMGSNITAMQTAVKSAIDRIIGGGKG